MTAASRVGNFSFWQQLDSNIQELIFFFIILKWSTLIKTGKKICFESARLFNRNVAILIENLSVPPNNNYLLNNIFFRSLYTGFIVALESKRVSHPCSVTYLGIPKDLGMLYWESFKFVKRKSLIFWGGRRFEVKVCGGLSRRRVVTPRRIVGIRSKIHTSNLNILEPSHKLNFS